MNVRINAAARALCTAFSKDFGNEVDNWKTYQKLFISDAKTALDAADKIDGAFAKAQASLLEASLMKRIEDQDRMLVEYRRRYGVLGVTQ
jgi:hypothetical protein